MLASQWFKFTVPAVNPLQRLVSAGDLVIGKILSWAFSCVGICLCLAFSLPLSAQAHAQGYTYTPPRFEMGLHFTGLRLRDALGEGPAGIGGRFTYNHLENLAFEGEINYFPQDPSGDFGENQGLFGVKAGGRFEDIGLFAKVRPGFVHFGGDALGRRLSERTQFACDVGGVIEYYPSPRWLLRMDLGDTIIPFGGTRFISFFGTPAGPNVVRLGTTHNFQASFGFAVRF